VGLPLGHRPRLVQDLGKDSRARGRLGLVHCSPLLPEVASPTADSLLTLLVQPRSSRNAVVGEREGAVLIRLRAAPAQAGGGGGLQRGAAAPALAR
jgi:hypothetical protein